jgi:hypothetical protein
MSNWMFKDRINSVNDTVIDVVDLYPQIVDAPDPVTYLQICT